MMPKVLCIASLVVAGILFLLFVANLCAGFPFGPAGGMLMNLGMIFGALVIGTFSVLTFLEVR